MQLQVPIGAPGASGASGASSPGAGRLRSGEVGWDKTRIESGEKGGGAGGKAGKGSEGGPAGEDIAGGEVATGLAYPGDELHPVFPGPTGARHRMVIRMGETGHVQYSVERTAIDTSALLPVDEAPDGWYFLAPPPRPPPLSPVLSPLHAGPGSKL